MDRLFKLIGASDTNYAEVTSNNEVKVVTDQTSKLTPVGSEGLPLRTVSEGRLDIGQDTLLFYDSFDDTVVDARKWATTRSTNPNNAVSSGRLIISSSVSTESGMVVGVISHRLFSYTYESPICTQAAIIPQNLPDTGTAAEWGFGSYTVSGLTPLPVLNGAFFRWKPDGTFECVVATGGIETSDSLSIAKVLVGNTPIKYMLKVTLSVKKAIFEINGVVVSEILSPSGAPILQLPSIRTFGRVYVVPSMGARLGPQLIVTGWAVTQQVLQTGKNSRVIATSHGEAALSMPTTPYASPTANNEVLQPSAAQSNTSARITVLAGRFNVNAAAGADRTSPADGLLQAVLVPTNRRFICTGYVIHCGVAGAAVVTATLLEFSLFFNSTAASLATADSFNGTPQPTYAPRRVFAGTFHFPAGSPIGYTAPEIRCNFSYAPIVVESGRRFGVVCRQVAGAATASLTYRGYVQPLGYWE
jgi:hypothetical protein